MSDQPTNDQIMEVIGLTSTSTQQFCDRLRDLFAGFDYFDQSQDWLMVLREWAKSPTEPLNFRRASVPERVQELLSGPKSLEQMQAETNEVNRANGWFDGERSVTEGAMLMVTEVAEAVEAWRSWGMEDMTGKVSLDKGLPSEDGLSVVEKPEGVGSEYADQFIRLLDQVERDGINLRAEYERKIAYNRLRGYRHGGKAV